jgi:hypothetical protein
MQKPATAGETTFPDAAKATISGVTQSSGYLISEDSEQQSPPNDSALRQLSGGFQACDSRTVNHSSENVESGSMARAIPGSLRGIPIDEAA